MGIRIQHIYIIVFLIIFSLLTHPSTSFPEEIGRRSLVVKVVERVSPAVVNINTERVTVERGNPFFGFSDPFFDEFFRDFFEPYYRKKVYSSLGSGVIIDPKGYILTNEHVIRRASRVRITMTSKKEFEAEAVGADVEWDLAVLRIGGKESLPYVEMGRSTDLMIGETVIAIGNPFGLSHTVTTGVISALHRSVVAEDRTYNDFIQTDASINPGNSGGPLLNINGDLIGINTAIYAKAQGIGFAIPINRAKRVVEDLIHYGKVHLAWIGVQVQDMNPQLRRYFEIRENKGILVINVDKDSPADDAGIKRGDIILLINGKEVDSRVTYFDLLKGVRVGERIDVSIIQDEGKRTVSLKTKEFPEEMAGEMAYSMLGIRVRFTSRNGAQVEKVARNSPAGELGIRKGDVILKMGARRIESYKDFKKAVIDARGHLSLTLTIQRGIYIYQATMEL